MTPELTPMQQRTLDWIAGFIQEKGFSPTISEIRDGLGLRSPASPQRHVRKLWEAGRITCVPNKSRTIRLVEAKETVDENA